MIQRFVDRFMENKKQLEAVFADKHPGSYEDLVTEVIKLLDSDKDEYGEQIDSSKIHEIDDGHYQGTLLYVIPVKTYQPSEYFYVKINYGSCSGCDTLRAISNYSSDRPTKQQIKDYIGLALNIVQGLKKMKSND
jgi:ferredoxin-like protein FixX